MAKIKGTGGEVPAVKSLIELSGKVIGQNRNGAADGAALKHMVAVEGAGDAGAEAARVSLSGAVGTALDTGLSGLGFENLTDAQKEAATMVLGATGNLMDYHRAASTMEHGMEGSADTMAIIRDGVGGASDTDRVQLGMEYYNDEALERTLNYSFALNVNAARQDAFGEAFFRTLTIDPSEGGIAVQVDTTRVHREARYSANEAENKPYVSRNILDAGTDATVLEDQSVQFVPFLNPDDSNKDNFINGAIWTGKSVDVAGTMVPTAPLNPKKGEKQLKSLAAHPGLVKESVLDTSDEFNARIKLAKLFFGVRQQGEAASAAQVIQVNTANLARASFNKSAEGDAREYSLTFADAKFPLSKGTKDVAGQDVSALDDLISANYTLSYTLRVNASINIATGAETFMAGGIKLVALVDEDGNKVDMTSGAGKTLVENIVIELDGYDYDASLSNSNRRAQGILSTSESTTERFKVGLGSPLTSRKPLGANGDQSGRLNDLMVMARFRTANMAITKLLNYTETLKEVVAANTNPYEVVSIEGAGRHYVAPWYDEASVDVSTITASLDNVEAEKNLTEAVLGIIRNQITRAYKESRIKVATDYLMPGQAAMPKVIIGTDAYTAAYLEREGDVRILGNQFEYEIVITNDTRFEGRVQWVFNFDGASEGQAYNPLNFGYHLFVPELVTDISLTRNGGTSQELTVQPRNEHFVSCPITGILNVNGIREFVSSKPSIHTEGLQVTVEVPTP